MKTLSRSDLKKIKKAELHRHLEGAIRYSTIVALAKEKKINLPYDNATALLNSFCVTSPMKDLKSVLDKFELTRSLLDSEDTLERITFEAVEDAHQENIDVLELRYSLSFIQRGRPDFGFEKIHSAIVKGLERAKKVFPVKTGLISIIGRVDEPKIQKRVGDFTAEAAETFVGIDLADNENAVDVKTLRPIFEKAKKSGLHVTIHAGESPGSEQNVMDSIEQLGAERIGHGLQIFKNPKIIDYVIKHGVHLELCPYSNYLTNAVASHQEHPFRQLFEAGVSVSINSDDPGIFSADLTYDYELLQQHHGFTFSEFEKCNQMARAASFLK